VGFKPFAAVRGIFLIFVVLTAGLAAAPAGAIENLRKYAGIVVDAKSGQVLYETQADSRRYPASLSKVMTLYIVFQELKAGNLALTSKLTISRHAANAVPTKLGLKAGATITLGDAMKSLVTLSANDMARAIAEHISGTEEKFAERMTATARALGMAKTTYRNASGLPDGAQITTVRDQAILAIAVFQHFREYYELFQTTSFTYGNRTFGNHNRVLGYMGAVDGIKTGYINASGSNLMTAARKDGRHVVVIAFGFNSGAARDEKVRQLVRDHFAKGRQGDYLQTAMIPIPGRHGGGTWVAQARPVPVIPMPMPGFRLAELVAANNATSPIPTVVAMATLGGTASDAAAQLAGVDETSYQNNDVLGAWLSDTFALEAVATSQAAPVPFLPPARLDGTVTNSVASTAPQAGSWHIQLGAVLHPDAARSLIESASAQHQPLGDMRPHVEQFERHGQTFYRARYLGFGSRELASETCARLAEASLSCLVIGG
jgi:D-alanyl-D-alanine carboxypeptidase